MTNIEKELIGLIRENDNPANAVEIAIKTIVEFLEQGEQVRGQSVAYLQAQV